MPGRLCRRRSCRIFFRFAFACRYGVVFAQNLDLDRLKAFTVDELHALVFRLDIAETVEPLDEVAAELRDEIIRELKERESSFPNDPDRKTQPH